jgi:uncharacterized protein YndB with AHSA1/START domain
MKRMMLAAVAVVGLGVGLGGVAATAQEDPLAPLGFLLASCWKGEMAPGVTDTHCFDALHGGRFIRDRHLVEGPDGPYSGESVYRWDAATKSIRYTYAASDGGYSEGVARVIEGGLAFDDRYQTARGEAMTLRARWMREAAGGYSAITETEKDGTWKPMFTVRFTQVPAPSDWRPMAGFPDVIDNSDREADGSRTIRLSTRVQAPPDVVWRAISTAEGWKRWAVKAAWVDFRVGGVIETSYDPAAALGSPANIRNEIVAYIPGRMLAIRNIQAPPGFQHAEEFSRTSTVIELLPRGTDETVVVLTGAGFRPEPAFETLYGQFLQGDAWTLQNMKTVLEGG